MKHINEIMKELAQWQRLAEESAAMVDALKDQIKSYMITQGLDVLTGDEHKARLTMVLSSRIDTTALKKELPDIAARYTREIGTTRFTFN